MYLSRKYLVGLAQTLYFLGVVIGMLVFGILSDMYGRYKHKQTNDTRIYFIIQENCHGTDVGCLGCQWNSRLPDAHL